MPLFLFTPLQVIPYLLDGCLFLLDPGSLCDLLVICFLVFEEYVEELVPLSCGDLYGWVAGFFEGPIGGGNKLVVFLGAPIGSLL